MAHRLRVGILGAGEAGTGHAHAFARLPNVEVAALWSRTRQRARKLAAALRTRGWSGTLQTAFGVTLRQAATALTRRTWGIAESSAELMFHLEWRGAYYHFTRPHMALNEPLTVPHLCGGRPLPQRGRPRTPAQTVGLTDHRWTIVELLSYALPITLG